MKTTIRLGDEDQRLVMEIVNGWEKHAKDTGRIRVLIDKKKDVKKVDKESFGAEVAFCRLFNCEPDIRIAYYNYYDTMLPDGTTVNVKSTNLPYGNLIVPLYEGEKDGEKPDIYALMIGNFPNYKYFGWIESKIILDDNLIKNNLPTIGYFMKRSRLHA